MQDKVVIIIVLCTDVDELNYIIVRLSMNDVYGLLHGEESIYNTILKQNEYWNVISGREIPLDEVKRLSISELDVGLLPKEDVYFEIVSTSLKIMLKSLIRNILCDII